MPTSSSRSCSVMPGKSLNNQALMKAYATTVTAIPTARLPTTASDNPVHCRWSLY